MLSNFTFIFYWWLLVFGLGASFLPLTFLLFNKFFDKGYAFAKILAILGASYSVWFLGSLKILPFFSETAWLVVIGLFGFNFWLFKKRERRLKKILQKHWRIFVFEEALFFICLALWSWVRGFQPDIQGLEKFMDFGFLNSILRAKFFPPPDMWLAGETINYYYFGHLISAVLTKLSGLNPAVAYNLMIATIFGLTFNAGFSLGANLTSLAFKKRFKILPSKGILKSGRLAIASGLLTAFLLTLGGNFHPLYWFAKNGNFKSYWYPDATRFIIEKFGAADNTIHEFPIYSFVVADLHGHMINIPNVLLILALTLNLGLMIHSRKNLRKIMPFIGLLAFCLGIAFMTNAWDYPIYALVIGMTVFFFNQKTRNWLEIFWKTGLVGGILFIGSLIFSLPFHLHFKNIAQGVAPVSFHSPPWMLLVLWGFPLATSLSFLVFSSAGKQVKNNQSRVTDVFVLILLAVSWLLVLLPEFIHIKDIYIHSHQRANTMFKLTYQAFIMFSLAIGYIFTQILTSIKEKRQKALYLAFCILFFIPVLTYPYFAIKSYYGLKTYRGLDGLAYLQRAYPQDYEAINWLKKNISGQPVILEAVGESYTDFARVSANTGLPTVLGWRVHEWLWRGSFDEVGKRTEEVKSIYESTDLGLTQQLLSKYQVDLIFLGNLERQQYPQLREEKLNQLGKIIFSSGTTKIYQLVEN